MKSLKISGLFLAFGIAILSAFAANTKPAGSRFLTPYYYTGNLTDVVEMRKAANWTDVGTPCSGSSDPCSINWSGNRATFNTHIASFPDVPTVVGECATKRN